MKLSSSQAQASAEASAYRPTTIRIPAATAIIAITVPSPEKLKLSNGINPVKTSQAANNSIPTLLVNFIGGLL